MKYKFIFTLMMFVLFSCGFAITKLNLDPRKPFVVSNDILTYPSQDVVDDVTKKQQDLANKQKEYNALISSSVSKSTPQPPAAAPEIKTETPPPPKEGQNKIQPCKTPCKDIASNPGNYQNLQGVGLVRLSDLCICPQPTTQPLTTKINY